MLLEQLNAQSLPSVSHVRLDNSYFITRSTVDNTGKTHVTTTKQTIVTIADYKKLSKESGIVSIRPNYVDG